MSYAVSHKTVEIGNKVLNKNLEEWEIDEAAYRIEYPVRKLAHMTEYFLLAIAVSFPFYVYGVRGIALMVVADSYAWVLHAEMNTISLLWMEEVLP